MKLQHKVRRDGLILVGGSQYELDDSGCVEVSEEHGEMLLQGAMWREYGEWGEQAAKVQAVTPPIVAGARRVRTPEEMRGLVEAEGVQTAPEPQPEPEPEEEEEEEIEVSMDMRKSELAEIAERLGLNPAGLTKSEIIDLIEEQE